MVEEMRNEKKNMNNQGILGSQGRVEAGEVVQEQDHHMDRGKQMMRSDARWRVGREAPEPAERGIALPDQAAGLET